MASKCRIIFPNALKMQIMTCCSDLSSTPVTSTILTRKQTSNTVSLFLTLSYLLILQSSIWIQHWHSSWTQEYEEEYCMHIKVTNFRIQLTDKLSHSSFRCLFLSLVLKLSPCFIIFNKIAQINLLREFFLMVSVFLSL